MHMGTPHPLLHQPLLSPSIPSGAYKEQAKWCVCVGLENPQLEEEWEWLRETRHFQRVHPRGDGGSVYLEKLQKKQVFAPFEL